MKEKTKKSLTIVGIVGGIWSVIGLIIGYGILNEHYTTKPRQDNYRIVKRNIEQIFRDHNGIRAYFVNKDKRFIEKKYFDNNKFSSLRQKFFPSKDITDKLKGFNSKKNIIIYKDLPKGEKPYVQELISNPVWKKRGCEKPEVEYLIEIHLPEDGKISAGNDAWAYTAIGPKIHEPMKEIK